MDRFAEQLFGRPAKDTKYSSRDKDGPGFMESIARTFVASAADRAMGQINGQRGRGGGFDHEDFRSLGGFVLEMMNGGDDGDRQRKKSKKRRHSERETTRDVPREKESAQDPGYGGEPRKRRRGHRLSGSPLHVTFAEPLQDFDYPPVRKRHRRRHEDIYEPDPRPSRSDSHRSRRRSHERRSRRRHHARVDLHTLKSELEDMSSTIIGLNARSTTHLDCEFYDKFARKGGRLQDAIGSTLGQIRELDGGASEDEERRERKRRRRERRERRERW